MRFYCEAALVYCYLKCYGKSAVFYGNCLFACCCAVKAFYHRSIDVNINRSAVIVAYGYLSAREVKGIAYLIGCLCGCGFECNTRNYRINYAKGNASACCCVVCTVRGEGVGNSSRCSSVKAIKYSCKSCCCCVCLYAVCIAYRSCQFCTVNALEYGSCKCCGSCSVCEAVVASVGAVGLTVTATVQESLFVTSS